MNREEKLGRTAQRLLLALKPPAPPGPLAGQNAQLGRIAPGGRKTGHAIRLGRRRREIFSEGVWKNFSPAGE